MKYLKDILYVALAVALAFGIVTTAFPKIDIDVPLEPVTLPTEAPAAPSSYIEEIESLVSNLPPDKLPARATVVIVNFWSVDCPYCKQQLSVLDAYATERLDIPVFALTMEQDAAVIDGIIQELGLQRIFIFYGMDGQPRLNVPNTHVLFKIDGEWKLAPEGTWIGYGARNIAGQTIRDYISKEERDNHQL